MNRIEFINKLFIFTRTTDTDNTLLSTYDKALQAYKDVDWSKLYDYVTETAEDRFLLAPKHYVEKSRKFVIKDETISEDKGSTIVIEFLNGKKMEFIATDYGTPQKEVRYNKDIKRVIQYPKEAVLYDCKLINDYEVDKSKIKVLYEKE